MKHPIRTSGDSKGFGVLLAYYVVHALVAVLQWSPSDALELHLSTDQNSGLTVFNVSSGPRWSYAFDKKRSTLQAETLFYLNHFGEVSLARPPDCSKIVHNPFFVYINSRHSDSLGYANYTVLPLKIFIHGENCFIKFKRKNAVSSLLTSLMPNGLQQLDKSNTILISIQLKEQFGTCLPKDNSILSVFHYLPKSVSNCIINEAYVDSSQFYINLDTGYLRSTDVFCLNFSSSVVFIDLDVAICAEMPMETHIPIEVILYPEEFPKRISVVEDYISRILPRHRRLRRWVKNTPPSFEKSDFVENVPEEQNPGYSISTFTATDPDPGDAGRITYSLLATKDGRSQNMFGIDPSSGLLTITQRLDREQIPVHHFLVIAMDHGEPSLSGTASLTIYVNDINDHAPEFESAMYSQSISESISIGSTVLTVRANDEDSGSNAEVEYHILNQAGVNEAFRIDRRQGSILVRQQLDRERCEHYRLEIRATDKARSSERKNATAVVEITVLDENDNRPQFTRSSYMVEVSEDIDPTGSPVIAEIKAIDADAGANGLVRYSITSGNFLNKFSIDSRTGQLAVLQPLDFEKVQQYRLSIRAQDGGSPYKSNSTIVLIKVIDVNDNEPKFYTSLYQESVPENEPLGYTVMRVQAFDADSGLNSAVVYTLKHTTDDLPFEIDPTSGVLIISKQLDRETLSEYDFSVEARDQGTPPRSTMARIIVRVRDVNDNTPIFEPKVYHEIVSEESFPGTPVIAVTARDKDENARVTYTIVDGNINSAFRIDSQMGQGLIRVARMLNYQDQSRYILTVKASDGQLEDTAVVFINISDANTYRPIFQGIPYQVHVNEDKPVGSSIFKVYAVDNDVGENARITYHMDENDAFQIDPVTGEIVIKHSLDRELVSGYTIGVTAMDHGSPPQSDSADIEITIVDVNDNAPIFLEPEYSGRVEEDAFVGTSVLTIQAKDADSGLNGRIRYTFEGGSSGAGDFRLDPVLGILRVNKELDRERMDHYELIAYAVDRGTPEKSTSIIINIKVNDVNDNAPRFPAEVIDMYIAENSPVGSTVGTLGAVDPDEGVNAEIQYSILSTLDGDDFKLSHRPLDETAIITTATELDYEGERKEYLIMVRARSFHLFSDVKVKIHVQDTNDNSPELENFVIIFNNYKNHFPTSAIGRIPAFDPDEYDKLRYSFVSGNQANIMHLNPSTGMIHLDPRLNSDVPMNATLQVRVDGK
ncbi:hypothetical protein LSH36_119g03060 [Paralvinella palmiformis]|uniref:Cadherin domain-containing protein n=1 Tax=Paralvinella palmiformis TaxID=53620 RepID=A0AAD9JYA5_9ANNE|nr:hypothetical protein LSH36_119g03060 [Paralvinella palmiformis]